MREWRKLSVSFLSCFYWIMVRVMELCLFVLLGQILLQTICYGWHDGPRIRTQFGPSVWIYIACVRQVKPSMLICSCAFVFCFQVPLVESKLNYGGAWNDE